MRAEPADRAFFHCHHNIMAAHETFNQRFVEWLGKAHIGDAGRKPFGLQDVRRFQSL